MAQAPAGWATAGGLNFTLDTQRPDAAVSIPAPISAEELPEIVALLESVGRW